MSDNFSHQGNGNQNHQVTPFIHTRVVAIKDTEHSKGWWSVGEAAPGRSDVKRCSLSGSSATG